MDKRTIEKTVNRQLDTLRQTAELKALNYRQEISSHADYVQADAAVRSCEIELMRAKYEGRDTADAEKKLQSALRQRKTLEKEYGVVPEKLSPVYQCKICNDRGYIDGKRCECALKMERELMYGDSSFVTESQRFELSDEQSPDNAKAIGLCQKYADAFPRVTKKNIIISGRVATGKTFLAGCIFNRLAERGVPVLAVTAFQLVQAFLAEHTSPVAQKTGLYTFTDAPLLLIDDLGSEPSYKNVSSEYLFLLLNERELKNLGTVITTNLSPGQIKDVYGERIFSRLFNKNNSISLELKGQDKRIKI